MNRRIRNGVLLTSLLVLPMAFTHAAGLYKWTDAEGNVHYGQLPPTDRAAKKLTPTKDVPATQQQPDEEAIPEEAKRDAKQLQIKQQNCEIAKGNLQTYQNSSQIRQADGAIVSMSDEMRAQKIQEGQEMVDKFCN